MTLSGSTPLNAQPTMWLCVAVFLLWTKSGGCLEKANTSNLVEYTAADFYEKLSSGKMMFLYFERQVSPSITLFLVELERSADALQDYGVLVGKVNCKKEPVSKYCSEDNVLLTAFLFRGGKEFLSFHLDTVFDVNAIVSEVLFAILREEVRYVHTDADLLAMEKSARGKKDIVLGYVSSLGTQEHRAIMETTFVYGSKYQFILITGGPVLKRLGVNEASPSSRVWFLHCRDHRRFMTSTSSERCPLTRMRKPLSTLSLHSFLQLMEAPLLTEVHDDPSTVPAPQFPYQQTPQLFLFSQPETEHLDRETANTLAWKLKGLALLALIHRGSPTVKTPKDFNAAYRLPEKGSEVKYLTLRSLEEVLALFTNEETEEHDREQEVVEEMGDDEEDMEEVFDQLDDEVAASVYLSRGRQLDMDIFTELNTHNFHSVVTQSSLTVALFYLKWDAVSMTFLESFVEVAESLADADVDDVQMCAVDCGEWTDLCSAQSGSSEPLPFQPITAFPTVLLFRPQESTQHYRGMMGSQALYRFILLGRLASPLELLNDADVTLFLREAVHPDLSGHTPDKVLGLFDTHTHPGVSVFTEAARALRGKLLTGLLTDGLAQKWAKNQNVDLPAVLVFPSWQTDTYPSVVALPSSAEKLIVHIKTALLHPVPELTVENLPTFLSLGKALLLLFVGEEEDEIGERQNKALVGELRKVVELGGQRMEKYLPCWIHLGRTPAGIDVLGSYLGAVPPLPSLILTHSPSEEEIYQYPPRYPIAAPSVLQWLQRVEGGSESPAGMLGEESWPPVSTFYDFLAVMDKNDPSSARQQQPTREMEDGEGNGGRGVALEERTDGSNRSPTHPESSPNPHTEL